MPARLQANIVKDHGREHTRNLFWNFQDADQAALRAAVRRIARAMPSALDQLQATETFKTTGRFGGPVVCFFLRPSGYAALGVTDKAPVQAPDGTPHQAFTNGMQARGVDPTLKINDPEISLLDLDRANLTGYITGNIFLGPVMSSPQRRAIQNYRSRLSERGLVRFEVLGLDADRGLIRALARRLMEEGPEAARLRRMVSQTIAGEPPKKGGILAALRRSPLVGANLDLTRPHESGRSIEL